MKFRTRRLRGNVAGCCRRGCSVLSHAAMHWMIGRLRAEPKRRLTLMRAADAFEDFFASLNWSGSMYGWRFLDDPSLRRDWPVRPSLTIDIRLGAAAHTLFWFNECGREEDGTTAPIAWKGQLGSRAPKSCAPTRRRSPLDEFIAGGRRYWEALHGRGRRNTPRPRGRGPAGRGERVASAATPPPAWPGCTRWASTPRAGGSP